MNSFLAPMLSCIYSVLLQRSPIPGSSAWPCFKAHFFSHRLDDLPKLINCFASL